MKEAKPINTKRGIIDNDTLDHGILACKLYTYGIRSSSHKWFVSYLSNRHQKVDSNGVSAFLKAQFLALFCSLYTSMIFLTVVVYRDKSRLPMTLI